MLSFRHVLPSALLLAILSSCITAGPLESKGRETDTETDTETFQKLLDQVDPPSLHAALHDFSPKKFKHGMFPEDRTAVEAIHRDEPKIATGIIHMANLAKRQDISNGTVATSSSQAGSPEPASTRVTPVPQGPVSSSSPSPAGSESSATPAANSPAVTSSPATSMNASPSTSVAQAETPGSTGSSSESASSSDFLTAGEVITTTNAVGLTIVSTVGGGVSTESPSGAGQSSSIATHTASSRTSTLIQTSTLPNGSKSTITAITVVPAATTGETPSGSAGAPSTSTASGSPGLQTGEAAMTRGMGKEMVLMLGGAVGFAMMM